MYARQASPRNPLHTRMMKTNPEPNSLALPMTIHYRAHDDLREMWFSSHSHHIYLSYRPQTIANIDRGLMLLLRK